MQTTIAKSADSIPVTLSISIGDCVQAWREYRDLRPSDLAEGAQVTRSYISSLEHNAIKNPRDEQIRRIAAALDIDTLILFARQFPPGHRNSHPSEEQFSNGDSNVNIHLSPITLGTEIERRLRAAGLSDQELQVIATSLLSVTDQMLEIVNATR